MTIYEFVCQNIRCDLEKMTSYIYIIIVLLNYHYL